MESRRYDIANPLLPFGSVHTESLYPVFQSDPLYGINSQNCVTTSSGSGTTVASNELFVASTGASVGGFGVIQSRKRLRYRPGQGIICRFTAMFTTPVANSIQIAGLGSSEDGLYIGYNGTQFGILYSKRGVRDQHTLTINTGSSTNENVTITLAGTAYQVAVTNSGLAVKTAYEISRGSFGSWFAEANGSTVTFINGSAADSNPDTFALTATTATGSWVETKEGVASTDQWIYQSSWNGNTLLSSVFESAKLDPTKMNVYQIGMTYLGAGHMYIDAMSYDTDGQSDWIRLHTIQPMNKNTASNFGNPSFPFTMAAYSAGSSTNLSVSSASFAGFTEGTKKLQGPRFTYQATLTSVTSASYHALFTIRCNRVLSSRASQCVVNLLNVSGAVKHTQPVTLYIIRNATLAGTPNFSQYATTSCCSSDTSATTCTFSSNDQLLWAGQLGETGEVDHHFINDEVTIQPGETITLAARSSTGTPAYVLGAINVREDQ